MNCEHCGQALPDDSPAGIQAALLRRMNWEGWYGSRKGTSVRIVGDRKATLVDYKQAEISDYEGFTSEVWIVFEIDGKHYRKEGTGDSYGHTTWEGPFSEVTPKQKTITVFE